MYTVARLDLTAHAYTDLTTVATISEAQDALHAATRAHTGPAAIYDLIAGESDNGRIIERSAAETKPLPYEVLVRSQHSGRGWNIAYTEEQARTMAAEMANRYAGVAIITNMDVWVGSITCPHLDKEGRDWCTEVASEYYQRATQIVRHRLDIEN